jgi:hypothetical protein
MKVRDVKWGSTRKGECVILEVEDHLECYWRTYYEGKKTAYPDEKCSIFKEHYEKDAAMFCVVYEIEVKGTRSVFFKPYGKEKYY